MFTEHFLVQLPCHASCGDPGRPGHGERWLGGSGWICSSLCLLLCAPPLFTYVRYLRGENHVSSIKRNVLLLREHF